MTVSKSKQRRNERRRNRQVEKVTDVLKRGVVGAFWAVNAVAFAEGALTVAEARQNNAMSEMETNSVADRAKIAFFSTAIGVLEAIVIGLENSGAVDLKPCERSYLPSCMATSLVSDNDRFNAPQYIYQMTGGIGSVIGGVSVGLVDGTVGVPKMQLSR